MQWEGSLFLVFLVSKYGECMLDLLTDPSDFKDFSWSSSSRNSSQIHDHYGHPKPGSSQTSSPSQPPATIIWSMKSEDEPGNN